MIEVVCEGCGKLVKMPPSQYKRSKRHFKFNDYDAIRTLSVAFYEREVMNHVQVIPAPTKCTRSC